MFQVTVNGRLGEQFDSFLDTEQGSELSPLLSGLFMDLLYELLKLKVPEAASGPVLGNINISNLMYADAVRSVVALTRCSKSWTVWMCFVIYLTCM